MGKIKEGPTSPIRSLFATPVLKGRPIPDLGGRYPWNGMPPNL